MRPQKAKRMVDIAIKSWLEGNKTNLSLALPALLKLHEKCIGSDIPDIRSGEESYGYSSSENNYHTMLYISDRYNITFRLRWIIDGIKNGKLLEE